jgi:hypothetical protein
MDKVKKMWKVLKETITRECKADNDTPYPY